MAFIDLKQTKTHSMEFGGMTVEVVEVPRGEPETSLKGFWQNIQKASLSVIKGMKVTLGYLVHPSTVVTQQYPENRSELKMFDRYRSQLRLAYNENGEHLCNGCDVCEQICPNGSIKAYSRKNSATKKKEIDHLVWRWDICTFCNFCVFACPHGALEMTGNFESAVYDRRLLIYNLNAYAGPPAKELKKLSPEEKKQAMEPRDAYSGEVPMAGAVLPGITTLGHSQEAVRYVG